MELVRIGGEDRVKNRKASKRTAQKEIRNRLLKNFTAEKLLEKDEKILMLTVK